MSDEQLTTWMRKARASDATLMDIYRFRLEAVRVGRPELAGFQPGDAVRVVEIDEPGNGAVFKHPWEGRVTSGRGVFGQAVEIEVVPHASYELPKGWGGELEARAITVNLARDEVTLLKPTEFPSSSRP